ncbi:MAG: enoyl-CoA hydratase/isomerase family protein [Bacteroidetes bacterium]|nr:enoyl-CoA hydratase/isomerase family protein [Bacteroidota bacterium]MCB0514225.1 enoyl-CoA hydratase/isomerase family protein [Bacteroidota bacterium]
MTYTEEQIQNFNNQNFAYLIIEEKENVLYITLNRPEKRNAFHLYLANELAYALAYAHYTNSIWCVVLKANGPIFCAGADLKAFAGENTAEKTSTIPMPKDVIKLGDEFNGLHKPCIAQVHADVYAGGFLMIGGCTHVIAVESAKFGLPEVKRGIFPFQVMATLEPLMSARQLLDLCIRAKILSAKEAQEIGIVSEVVKEENLELRVQELIGEIKEQSPTAIRLGLKAFQEMKTKNAEEKHKYLHTMLMDCLKSKDAAEGLLAFKEKRKPNWSGN